MAHIEPEEGEAFTPKPREPLDKKRRRGRPRKLGRKRKKRDPVDRLSPSQRPGARWITVSVPADAYVKLKEIASCKCLRPWLRSWSPSSTRSMKNPCCSCVSSSAERKKRKNVKHNAEINLPVELIFDVLPPMVVEGMEIPAQIDIREVLLEVTGPAGKPRKVDITKGIPEEQILLWEDEIVESLNDSDLA